MVKQEKGSQYKKGYNKLNHINTEIYQAKNLKKENKDIQRKTIGLC